MGRARASLVVPGRASEVEALWYDPKRWAAWVDGFGHIVKLEGHWPQQGARLVWQSVPGGRGLVQELVVAYESRTGQTLQVEDASVSARQTVAFTPGAAETEITLTLEYTVKERNPFTPVVDLLFIRRAFNDSLRRTLAKFAIERKAEMQFG